MYTGATQPRPTRRGALGCAGCGCADCGMGDTASLPGDLSNVISDIFVNSDGSINWPAALLAAAAAVLLLNSLSFHSAPRVRR